MTAHWTTKPLGDICEILDSKRKPVTKSDRKPGPFPYYGATGILDYVADYIFDEKLILIGEDGAKWGAGENTAFTAEGQYWVNNHAHVIRPRRSIVLDEWIVYYINANDQAPFITGLTVPKLNQAKLCEIPVPLPPLAEQKRIVAILDEAFAGIAAATANAEKNLANARELFDKCLEAAFLDFGDGWIESRFGDCFRLRSGDGLTSKDMLDGPYPVFGGNGIAGTHSHFNLSGNNVIIGRVGALCGNVRNIKEDIWLTDNAFKIVDYQHEFDNAFLTYLLNFKDLRSYARQTAQPVISNSSLKDVLLQFPRSLADQRHIAVRLDALSDKIEQLESVVQKKISTLAELKQAILQKAFSGELTGIKTRHCEAA